MRARLRDLSFRNKLLLAFLLIGVVPLLISTLLMLNIFRVTLAGNARDAAQAELDGAVRALDTLLGEGVETLREALSARISGSAPEDDCLTVQRHIDRARGAQAALARAVQAVDTGVPLDVAAVELWEARRELGEITGDDASEAVVSEIFASFCVGK